LNIKSPCANAKSPVVDFLATVLIQRQVKSLYGAANKLIGTFDQCSPAVSKKLYFVPIACQYMLANCGPNTERNV